MYTAGTERGHGKKEVPNTIRQDIHLKYPCIVDFYRTLGTKGKEESYNK